MLQVADISCTAHNNVQRRNSGLLRYDVVSFGEWSPTFRLITTIYETSGTTYPDTGPNTTRPQSAGRQLSTSDLPRVQSASAARNDRSQACSCGHVLNFETCNVQEITRVVTGCLANAASSTGTCCAEPTRTVF